MIVEWEGAKMKLRGLRLSVQGDASQAEEFMKMLMLQEDGREGEGGLMEEVRELVIRLPSWNESTALPIAVGYLVSSSPSLPTSPLSSQLSL